MKERYELKVMKASHYEAQFYFDYFNERLRIVDYRGNVSLIMEEAKKASKHHSFTKLIFHARPEHWQQLLSKGFVLEAVFKGFFNGTDCYAMSYYTDLNRRTSKYWVEEDHIIASLSTTSKPQATQNSQDSYQFRLANVNDAKELAELYKQVFAIYPTPMNDPNYIEKVIAEGSLFFVSEHEKKIVSAASADVNKGYHHAEMTDCATLPDHRKYGLMKKLLQLLERELLNSGIYCAFSIARALSPGMNAAFYQLGYKYTGRMINNCYIFDKMEDMNVWVKDLSNME
ncbi:putative beta-lysine N-acetyltransferase [Bacillus sp. Marseille-P3661]|uniref:putative beta-lysine N-acetyltransferase n=1 Tax=Bacillus sp. Marseille-P3661 TaxID=1936234 RepID=UPI000C847414|nr:putative beta-lysine N-acetyltransferase [Bacillus sp. Marseille-P3661]